MAVATAETPAAAPPTSALRCKSPIALEEQFRRRLWIKAGAGHTQDDVRHPDYFRTQAPKLRRHDVLTVLADDESWEMEMSVERVLTDGVRCNVRKVYARETIAGPGQVVDDLGEFFSEFRAGEGWCIVRRKDGHPVIKGHSLQVNAIAEWRRNHPRKAA